MDIKGIPLPPEAQELVDNLEDDFEQSQKQSLLLFDKAVQQCGVTLWTNGAWKNENCEKKCPFGEECDKRLFQKRGKSLCYGQIYIDTPVKLNSNEKNKILSAVYGMISSFGCIRCKDNGITGANVLNYLEIQSAENPE